MYSFEQNGPKYCHLCPAATSNNSSKTQGNHKKVCNAKTYVDTVDKQG